MQCGLVRVAAEHIVDGRAARQHAGDDGEKTENYQTGITSRSRAPTSFM
jgi:hypothetical protein